MGEMGKVVPFQPYYQVHVHVPEYRSICQFHNHVKRQIYHDKDESNVHF